MFALEDVLECKRQLPESFTFFLFVMLIREIVIRTPLGTQNFNLKGQKYEKGFAYIGIACHTMAKNVEIILSFSLFQQDNVMA